jgi:peptidoglycan/LPS O-acetylase OafA/YrhL
MVVSMPPKRRFFVELQSLRGLAALLVLLGHGINIYAEPKIVYHWALICNGRAAVVLFFVLSGFVLTRSLAEVELSLLNWGRFLVRRAARIFPAIWFVSLLSIVYILTLRRWVPVPDGSASFLSHFGEARLAPLSLLASFAGLSTALVPQLWTVSLELAASIVMPLIAFLAFNRPRAFVCLALASLMFSFSFGQHLPLAAGIFGPSFVAGAWLATGSRWQRRLFAMAGSAANLIAGLLAFLFLFTQFLPLAYTSPLACLIETFMSAAIIGLIVYSDAADIKILRTPYLTRLGDISYSLYLVHYLIGGVLLSLLTVWQVPQMLGLVGAWKPIIFAGCMLVVTVVVADMLHAFVERPGIEFGKRALIHIPKRSRAKVRT